MSREINIDAAVDRLTIESPCSSASSSNGLSSNGPSSNGPSKSGSQSNGPTSNGHDNRLSSHSTRSQYSSRSSAEFDETTANGIHPRQPIADPIDRRRRPVHMDFGAALELQDDEDAPSGDDAIKLKQQQRLRKMRELAPSAAAILYIQLAENNATGLRHSPGLMEHLVGLMHLRDHNGSTMATVRANAASALTTIIEKTARKKATERKIGELLRLVWYHCECLRGHLRGEEQITTSHFAAAISTMAELMSMSFEAESKDFLRLVGAQTCMTTLLRLDHTCYPQLRPKAGCDNPAEGQQAFSLRNSVRVNACTILCNLLVNNPAAKTELAQTQNFLAIIKKQLASPLEELVRVSAVLLQNLSFRVDNVVKSELSDANVIPAIVQAASVAQMKPTVVALTGALWNMSAHSSETYESNNRATLCSSPGGIQLIVNLLDIGGDDKNSQKILDNTAGVLQNISSHIVRHTPLLINARRLKIYPVMARCLRRRNAGSMLRSVVAALSNFAAGMAEDKEAIRITGIVPLLEDILSKSSQYSDPKIGVYARLALSNLSTPPAAEAPRRQSYPLQHNERRASPLTTDLQVETSFQPSPSSSNSDLNESSVLDSSLVHRAVPGRVHQRRQSRLEQQQQLYNSRENIVVNGSRDNLQVSSENIRNTVSADNLRAGGGYSRGGSEGGSGDVPQKPPRKRSSDISSTGSAQQQLPSNPSPFFSAQAPQALADMTSNSGHRSRDRPGESWHARSQSDSAAGLAHIPSDRLRARGSRRPIDPSESLTENGRPHHGHTRQPSTGSTSSAGRRHLLTPSPITPSSSQEIMLSQPIIISEDANPGPSILGPVEETTVTITQL